MAKQSGFTLIEIMVVVIIIGVLSAIVEEPLGTIAPNWNREGYIDDDEVPHDPWGTEYQYLMPGPDGSDYYVYSFGADRMPGGEGADADISTSDL